MATLTLLVTISHHTIQTPHKEVIVDLEGSVIGVFREIDTDSVPGAPSVR